MSEPAQAVDTELLATAAERIYCAVDSPSVATALRYAVTLQGLVGGLKLGLEFFTANGPGGVGAIQELGMPIFLDLKLHDIPNTVAGAMRSVRRLRPRLITVHATGGPAMLRAAADAAAEADERPLVIAVTALTSLDDADLGTIGVHGPVHDLVRRLAELAQRCGIDGVVCSPYEVGALRKLCDPGFHLVVPGIRPAGAARDDQKRVMTPGEAVVRGASVLVVGRPITGAPDPAAAARAVAEEVAAALATPSPGAP